LNRRKKWQLCATIGGDWCLHDNYRLRNGYNVMEKILLLIIALVTIPAFEAYAEEYRQTITIFVENKSPFPNRVQVQDANLLVELAEDCRIAKKVARLCGGNPRRELRPPPRENMTCALALALLEEPRCAFKDLIFDDWMDGGMKVKLTIHTDKDDYGRVRVRALNNTESWTTKPGLHDGDTVGHQ